MLGAPSEFKSIKTGFGWSAWNLEKYLHLAVMSIEVEKPLHVVELNIWRLFEHKLNSTFLEKEKTDCCWPIRQMRNITSQKCLRLTSAKLQAASQANTPSFRPSPSYPLYAMLEPVGFGLCNFESNIQEKDAPTRAVGTVMNG